MSLKYLTKRNALNATTKLGVTTHFNHLRSIPRAWLIRRSKHDPKLKSVRPADRIKWWNIVPGDQIRLRGDPDSTLHEVLSINRLSNRVFLKNTGVGFMLFNSVSYSQNYTFSPRPRILLPLRAKIIIIQDASCTSESLRYLTSRIPQDLSGDNRSWLPFYFSRILLNEIINRVFASRLGTSEPKWDYVAKRWVWKRFAVQTTPKMPAKYYTSSGLRRIHIPWPKFEVRKYPEGEFIRFYYYLEFEFKLMHPTGGLYDTSIDDVAKVTYQMPAFDPSPLEPLPRVPEEQEYLNLLYNSHRLQEYDDSAPFELYLKWELANPHSRAKKLERWKSYQAGTHELLKSITADELKHLDGRPLKQAKADAAFKWREQVKEDLEKKKKARWAHTAKVEEWERKKVKKAKKEDRQRKRLTELVLKDEPNQFLPSAVKEKMRKVAA